MTEIKELFKKVKWDSIITSVLTIVLGILCIAFPDHSADILCVMFGISLIVVGVTLFVRFAFRIGILSESLLILAIMTTILGLFVLIYPNTIQSFLTVLFGLYIVIDSAESLADSVYCAKAGTPGWLIMFLASLFTAILGVAVMFSTFDTVMIFAGIALLVEGIRRFVITLFFDKKIKDAKKLIKSQFNYDDPIEIKIEDTNENSNKEN